MAKSETKDIAQTLEIIAANTMCTREAVGAIAKTVITYAISFVAIIIATIVLVNNPVDTSRSLTGLHLVCFGVIIVFGLYAVIYPIILMTELNRTIKSVRESEERIFEDDKSEE